MTTTSPDPSTADADRIAGRVAVRVTVNGVGRDEQVEPRLHLADFLRERLGLTGTKLGCEHGVCGACTVLLDGSPVRACLVLAAQADGREVRTVEGLADGAQLSPLQQSFRRHHALQCGFCTAGFLMSATALLEENPAPEEAAVRSAISGNICRCTGYLTIVDAVLDAAGEGHGDGEG
jgi:carbon-monoxide dehydrogenase small subunit